MFNFKKQYDMCSNVIFIFVGIILALTLLCVILYFVYNNMEISLRKEAEAQRGKIEGVFDRMWKVVRQKTQVADEYQRIFKEVYPKIMEGRYGEGNRDVMQWVNEDNPVLKEEIYLDLMRSIEVLRGEFLHSQNRMLDIIREHSLLCDSYISKWFITNRSVIEYDVISSENTKAAVTTALEDDVELQFLRS